MLLFYLYYDLCRSETKPEISQCLKGCCQNIFLLLSPPSHSLYLLSTLNCLGINQNYSHTFFNQLRVSAVLRAGLHKTESALPYHQLRQLLAVTLNYWECIQMVVQTSAVNKTSWQSRNENLLFVATLGVRKLFLGSHHCKAQHLEFPLNQ